MFQCKQNYAKSIQFGMLFVVLFLFGLFLFPKIAFASTSILTPFVIDQPTNWTAAESPYIVSGSGFVDVQSDFVIEPGTVVSFEESQGVYVGGGSLTAIGTPELPIIFTSVDDTSPVTSAAACNAGAWGGFLFSPSAGTSIISHAEFRCGGTFTLDLGHYEIDPNPIDFETFSVIWVPELVTAEAFIDVQGGELTVDHSVFSQVDSMAVHAGLGITTDARHNWWGSNTGPTTVSNPGGTGASVSGSVLYDPWIGQSDVVTSTPTTSERNPVIFVPGIMGTEFVRREVNGDEEVVWLNLGELVRSRNDDVMDYLGLDEFGVPLFSNVFISGVLRRRDLLGIPGINYTADFIASLQEENYSLDHDLFLFAYDWRQDISSSSIQLSDYIQLIRQRTGSGGVNIVAHSMGGLVVKEYIRNHEANHGIDKLIFLGTPHLGSVNAIKTLIFGDDLGVRVDKQVGIGPFTKIVSASFLNVQKIKQLATNMPSLYHLLPSRDYFQRFGEVLYDFSKRKLLSFNETIDFFQTQFLNEEMVEKADQFHLNIDNLLIPSDISVYNINGCGLPTVTGIGLLSKKFNEDEFTVKIGNGDGTVPLNSSRAVSSNGVVQVNIPGLVHGTMPSNSKVIHFVTTTFADVSVPQQPPIANLVACGINGKLLSVHSPVTINVTDSLGQHVGVDLNGDIELGIPGSLYEELGENKFIFIPEPEEPTSTTYTLTLDGTATGTFNFRVTDIVEDTTEQTHLFLDVPVNAQSLGTMSVGFANTASSTTPSSPPLLLYDETGTGQIQSLPPDATTDEEDETDLTPPTTTVSFFGSLGDNGWYRSTTTVTLASTDEESGVLRTMYSLDQGITWQRYTEPLLFSTDGRFTLHSFSIDEIGNREEPQIITFSIDQTPPEAEFFFDPKIQDIRVRGVDSMTSTTVSTTPTTYTIRDEAGNTLQLVFREINRRILKRATLDRLVYNGQVVAPNARLTSFVWLTNTKNEILSLQQALRYQADEGLYALYTKIGNRTFIRERANWNTFTDRFESGMKVFRFGTYLGEIIYR